MKFLKRLKSSNFWVSMISAVVLILQAVFNVEIKTEYLNQIIMAILGLLVMSGIVSDGSSEEVTVKQSVDIEAIKENISNALTQVVTEFENNILDFVKQFEKGEGNTAQSTENIVNVTGDKVEESTNATVHNSLSLQTNTVTQTENVVNSSVQTEALAEQVAMNAVSESANEKNQTITIQNVAKSIVHEL